MRASWTLALALLLFAQLIAAVNIIYDETGWTKLEWHKYKLEYSPSFEPSPADEVIKSLELRKALSRASINSLDGPLPRSTAPRPLGLWAAEDGTLVETPDEESVEAAAEAVTCTVCHTIVSNVWSQVVNAIQSAEPINEDSLKDMFDEACEQAHVPARVLRSYRIVKVEAPEAGVTMFVVRSRKGTSTQQQQLPDGSSSEGGKQSVQLPGTEAEAAATIKSCKDLVNHHQLLLLKPIWKLANDYFINYRNLARRMQSKMRLDADDVDEYEDPVDDEEDTALQRKAMQHIPEHKLLPYDALCLDMELLCPLWASLGECAVNPKYMVGTARKLGHCRASCGKCTPDSTWRKHPIAKRELAATTSTILNSLRQTTCTSTKACLSGGGGSTIPASKNVVVQNAEVLPGAALAKMEGFVLGKPFWGIPGVEAINPAADTTGEAAAAATAAVDPGEALLEGDDLPNKHISIPGMDGFFVYQIHYKSRVYQYHMDTSQGTARVTEDHILGLYDAAATAAAAKRDAAAAITEAGRAWLAHQELSQKEDGQAAAAASDGRSAASAAGDGAGGGASSAKAGSSSAAIANGKAAAGSAAGDRAAAAEGEADSEAETSAAAGAGAGAAGKDSKKAAAGSAAVGTATKKGDPSSSSKAAEPAAAAGHPPPMLELLDYLPDTAPMLQSHWPYFRQMYTGGERCGNEGGGKPRQVELRFACSPHNSWRMLVREPQFCSYVVVVYHPGLCRVPRYAPVPKQKPKPAATAAGSSSSVKKKDGNAAAAGGDTGAAAKPAAAGKQAAVGGKGGAGKGTGVQGNKDTGSGKFGDKPAVA